MYLHHVEEEKYLLDAVPPVDCRALCLLVRGTDGGGRRGRRRGRNVREGGPKAIESPLGGRAHRRL